MSKYIYLSLLILLSGCAHYGTKQTDESSDYEISATKTNYTYRKITTQVSASTKAESKSNLTNFKALQTDKTQSTGVGSLSQEASGTTNAVLVLEKLLGIIKEIK